VLGSPRGCSRSCRCAGSAGPRASTSHRPHARRGAPRQDLRGYSALGDFLRLFSWPYGQLATFATLTRYLHEAWPVLALAWLCALFVWRRDESIQ